MSFARWFVSFSWRNHQIITAHDFESIDRVKCEIYLLIAKPYRRRNILVSLSPLQYYVIRISRARQHQPPVPVEPNWVEQILVYSVIRYSVGIRPVCGNFSCWTLLSSKKLNTLSLCNVFIYFGISSITAFLTSFSFFIFMLAADMHRSTLQ